MPYWHRQLIHRPVTDKLVGVVAFGNWTEPGPPITHELCFATIRITNPNCDIPIDLTQMSFINDQGGVIYEGPFLATIDNQGTKQTVDKLLPHRSSACQLRYCIPVAWTNALTKTDYGFPDPGTAGHWLAANQAVTQPIVLYTVEIEWWAAAQEAHPPIAFLQQQNLHTNDAYLPLWSSGMSSDQMVSLKHYKD